jgi:N-acetylated-alpha-linked acidic dipeptidase
VQLTIPRISSVLIAAAAGMSLAGMVAADAPAAADLEGFSSASAAAETQLEQRFDAGLSASDLREWLKQMTSAPNHVGSPHDKANAEFQLAKFKEWGWDASIETFSVLYPTPKEVSVELVAPTHFKATAPRRRPRMSCRLTTSMAPTAM